MVSHSSCDSCVYNRKCLQAECISYADEFFNDGQDDSLHVFVLFAKNMCFITFVVSVGFWSCYNMADVSAG